MCRKLVILSCFVLVLVLTLTRKANSGSPILKLDINQTNTAAETEEDFVSFTLADSGSQVDGITVEFGGTLDSRRRDTPAGIPLEQIYRDFIFSRPGAMTITLSGLAANTTYEITIYAWDTVSEQTRIADWTANGIFVCKTEFDGTQDPPTSEDDYAFTGKATADSTGTIFLESAPGEGTREVSAASHPFAFLNALVISSSAPVTKARRPDPANGALHEDTWVNLSWTPGDIAVSHDVYIGDNFNDVDSGSEGTFVGNQTDTFIVAGFPGFPFPDGLVPGTTYYWRIDEVNDAEPNSPWKGDVWSFGIPPKTAYFPDPADGAESVSLDVELSWTEGYGGKLRTVYFGDSFEGVSNATGGSAQGTTTYTPGTLTMSKTYYWRIDEFDGFDTYKGNVWSFITEGAVGSPGPAKGAVDVTQTPVLTWSPGVFADTHQVYFGTDADVVKNADTSSPEYKGSGNLGSENYEPGQLEWNTTYYWRIDEANNANSNSPWTGPLWSFTTANFLIIDDMEAYNDIEEGQPGSNRIYLAWADGYDNPAINGSVVGNATAPFAELNIVHGGLQSMPMSYDNAVGKSEATLTLTSNHDWTVKGVNTLTIWFRGNSDNAAEPMYVALNDSGVVNHDNPDSAQTTRWTQWNIDLQAFADQGVNLANVNTITIGLGNRSNPVAGGAGIMYFDDIRLYAPTP